MKPELVRNVLESYLRAWATGDRALLLSLFAPDCEWSDPVGTPPFKGHEGVGRFWDFPRTRSCEPHDGAGSYIASSCAPTRAS